MKTVGVAVTYLPFFRFAHCNSVLVVCTVIISVFSSIPTKNSIESFAFGAKRNEKKAFVKRKMFESVE